MNNRACIVCGNTKNKMMVCFKCQTEVRKLMEKGYSVERISKISKKWKKNKDLDSYFKKGED